LLLARGPEHVYGSCDDEQARLVHIAYATAAVASHAALTSVSVGSQSGFIRRSGKLPDDLAA
jgi:hypothetical protein